MSKTEEITWRSIAHVRWLQIQELKHKYPNDADLGAAVRELVNKTVTAYIENKKQHLFYALLLFAHVGYIGVICTNDLFNIYVFIEIFFQA